MYWVRIHILECLLAYVVRHSGEARGVCDSSASESSVAALWAATTTGVPLPLSIHMSVP